MSQGRKGKKEGRREERKKEGRKVELEELVLEGCFPL